MQVVIATHLSKGGHGLEIMGLGLVVADAYFSTSTFVDGIAEFGFHLVSRFRDNADLRYLYTGPSRQERTPKAYRWEDRL